MGFLPISLGIAGVWVTTGRIPPHLDYSWLPSILLLVCPVFPLFVIVLLAMSPFVLTFRSQSVKREGSLI